MQITEFQADGHVSEEHRLVCIRAVTVLYPALNGLPPDFLVSVLQSLILTCLQDYADPPQVWKIIQQTVDTHLPEVVRGQTAGSA